MGLIEEIRAYHEDPSNFESMTISGVLIDPAIHATIDRHYKRFLEVLLEYFPYILKTQWRELYGKSKMTGHNAVNELVELKVLGEGSFKGCHYVFPITRAVKWYTKKENANPFVQKQSNNKLLDHFMRAEYFLRTNQLIQISPDYFFNRLLWDRRKILLEQKEVTDQLSGINKQLSDLQEQIRQLSQNAAANLNRIITLAEQRANLTRIMKELQIQEEIIKEKSKGLPPFKIPEIAEGGAIDCVEEYQARKVFADGVPEFKTKLDYITFVQKCLSILPDRNCYFENISLTDAGFKLDLVIIHYHDSSKSRYHRLIDDVNLICDCFMNGSFTLRVLCESEKDQERADKVLKEVFRQRNRSISDIQKKRTNRKNLCEKYIITNTNIARYFQRGDSDLLVHESDLKDLEQIISQLQAKMD
ncbi:hypothetical protein [Paenibacillus luteus]|uniref:hypothetical protein n=1 Tax=Paenibacillus luteus TaxID=2545753 RepID=UPI001141231B|nr:hypothetical protein [Paenibacillus luteus]